MVLMHYPKAFLLCHIKNITRGMDESPRLVSSILPHTNTKMRYTAQPRAKTFCCGVAHFSYVVGLQMYNK
jgi:hypothetical protein